MHIVHTLRPIAIDLNGGGGIRGNQKSRKASDKSGFHVLRSATASCATLSLTPQWKCIDKFTGLSAIKTRPFLMESLKIFKQLSTIDYKSPG